MRRRQRPGQRLAAPYAGAPRTSPHAPRHRAYPKLMLAAQLLKQIHFDFPVHARPPNRSGDRRLRDRGWAKIGQHAWAKIR